LKKSGPINIPIILKAFIITHQTSHLHINFTYILIFQGGKNDVFSHLTAMFVNMRSMENTLF